MVASLPLQTTPDNPRRGSQPPLEPEASMLTIPEGGHPVFAIPFVIGDPASGEQVISGFYVPEQVEPIDLSKLSPAERDAVRMMLGIEEDKEGVTVETKTI
jgi:hypothetical protein